RLAISTAYWPMIWPAPEPATLLISGGTLELPVREPQANDALLKPLPGPESAPPEKPTIIRRSDMRIERIDRLGLELGTHDDTKLHVEEDDPLSAVNDLRRTWTMSRDAWQIRIETLMRLSCTRDLFLVQGSLRAWEGADEVCRREWDRAIPRDFLCLPPRATLRSSIGYLSDRGKAPPAIGKIATAISRAGAGLVGASTILRVRPL